MDNLPTDLLDSTVEKGTAELADAATSTVLEGGETVADEKEQKRRRFLLSLLAVLLLLLCGSSALFIRYLRQPEPLPQMLLPEAAEVDYAPHYLFSIYGMDRPVGVTLSPEGDRLYVAESDGERMVRVFNTDGEALGVIAPPRTKILQRAPIYLDTDTQGRLYVTDRLQHSVFVYDRDGRYLDTIINPDLTLSEYVAQHIGGQLNGASFSFNKFENFVQYQAPSNETALTLPAPILNVGWAPLGVFVDQSDYLYLTDVNKDLNRVREFSLPDDADAPMLFWHRVNPDVIEYGASGQENGEFLYPNKAAPDSQGRVYVSDGNNGRISVWDSEGNFLFNFGRGSGDGTLSLPRGIYIDQRDRLFVVDAVGQAVNVFDVSDSEPSFLYKFGDLGMDDGLFNYPSDIVMDESGRLYVADRENHRVQVWSY